MGQSAIGNAHVIVATRVARGTPLAPCLSCMPLHDVCAVPDEPVVIAVRADPIALSIERGTKSLYVADAISGAILRVDDGDRHRRIGTVAYVGTGGSPPRVGGIAVTPFGTLFATDVAGGARGTIVRIDPDGYTKTFDRVVRDAWRLGIAYDANEHVVYATQFKTSRFGAHDGEVIAIDLVSGEPSTILDGFAKPIGIVAIGSSLVVADARQRAVYRIDLRAGRAVQRLQLVGDVGRPDSICACSSDSVLVTSFDPDTGRGAVRRLWLDGRTQGIASGAWEPAGVATDGDRVFVGVRRANKLLVFPLL